MDLVGASIEIDNECSLHAEKKRRDALRFGLERRGWVLQSALQGILIGGFDIICGFDIIYADTRICSVDPRLAIVIAGDQACERKNEHTSKFSAYPAPSS